MLCLACSSSLPPKLVNNAIFITPCCERPICPNCLSSNPRLARYNPCLHCLGGVGIVSARSPQRSTSQGQVTNLDGGVHDSDVFVLGDDDEDEELGTVQESSRYGTDPSTPPPHYELKPSSDVSPSRHRSQPSGEDSSRTSSKYYIKPGDSLLGISLKYNIDGRLLCRLNGLPPSTLRTTPHLLHTRTFLTFPPSASPNHALPPDLDLNTSEQEKAQRVREKAEKRLQTLTKEVDWRVAKTYVALADPADGEDDDNACVKEAEGKKHRRTHGEGSNVESRAVDRYLDDDEWEQRERREGRGVVIPRFPLFEQVPRVHGGRPPKPWWKWN